MKAPSLIETARLSLVPPREDDAAAIFERYAGDVDVTRYLAWPRHRSLDDTDVFLGFSRAQWEKWPAGPYLIRARDDGRLLGSTGLAFDTADVASTGYVLARDAWGHGYATEATRAMVDLAEQLELTTLYALSHIDHRASQRVLEKCGFARDWNWKTKVVFPNIAFAAPQDAAYYSIVFDRAAA